MLKTLKDWLEIFLKLAPAAESKNNHVLITKNNINLSLTEINVSIKLRLLAVSAIKYRNTAETLKKQLLLPTSL